MGLTIRRLKDQEEKAMNLIADRRLYLTADRSRVVEEGEPEAAFLLVGEGSELESALAEQYGIVEKDGRLELRAKDQPEEKSEEGPSEDKAVKGPTENKAAKKPAKRKAAKEK